MQRQSLFLILSVVLMTVLFPRLSFAHGVVGKRLFVEPMVTEDANVFSEYDLVVPSYLRGEEGKELSLGTSLSLQLTQNLGLEMAGEWTSLNPNEGDSERGFQNPELTLKYVGFTSPVHEWIATFALSVELPAGEEKVGAENFYSIGTGFFYGKGFGDLPESLKYLQPLMVQGDVTVHQNLTREAEATVNTLSYDFAIYYSLPYLRQFVKDVGIPSPFNRLFPMVELNFNRVLNGPDVGQTEAFARPGFVWVGKATQVGLAAVIPINGTTRKTADLGVMGIVSLYLDDLFPKQFRMPIFGSEEMKR
jgi:hypothetical protein